MPKNQKVLKTNTFYPKILNPVKASKGVFGLDEVYLAILKCISYNGPSKEVSIIEFVNKIPENSYSREIIRNKIYGSSKILGLLLHGYIVKHERKFHLTVKGMLAALATGRSLKKIDLYKKYLDYVSSVVKDEKIIQLFEKFIVTDIYFFLCWHFINGMQLKKIVSYDKYQNNFLLTKLMEKNFLQYSEDITDQKIKSDYEKLKDQYLKMHLLVSNLINIGKLAPPIIIEDKIFTKQKNNAKKGKIIEKLSMTHLLVSWSLIMNELVVKNYDVSKLKFEVEKFSNNYEKTRMKQIKKQSIKEAKSLGVELEDMGSLGIEILSDEILEKSKAGYYSQLRNQDY